MMDANRDRIAGLDGLRAISILLVIFTHVYRTNGFPELGPLRAVAANGAFGVTVFFVLSGFLITLLLLREECKYRDISIASFYLRRALRILPPAFWYLGTLAILAALGVVKVSGSDLLHSAFFIRNLTQGADETGHYWSLAIEEQFYLLWPFVLFVMPRRIRLRLVVLLIALAPVWRQISYKLAGGAMYVNGGRFDLRYDALAVGCALALLRFDEGAIGLLRSKFVQNRFMPLLVTAALAILVPGTSVPPYLRGLVPTVLYILVALLINYVVDRPRGVLGVVLNSRPMLWCGNLSYSLYLWQQLFCWNPAGSPDWFRAFPQNMFLTVCTACLSYYVIEHPFTTLRKRVPHLTYSNGRLLRAAPRLRDAAAQGRA